ncbi:MAG: carboxypeptidase-like regulatory domain-containing protein, partial [Gemmatimonadales bacterium]|nr:carboxypeptidase-like regulatory domain-containing protein [Gemmatimonadales bacterium]
MPHRLLAAACRAAGLLLLLLPLLAAPLHAQGGADILSGTVTDDQGQPAADALVEALSNETKLVRSTRTDAKGRWRIVFPDGGGKYTLFVRRIGFNPVRRTVERKADEEVLVANVRLAAAAQQLEELSVRGRGGFQAPAGFQPPTPGASEAVQTADRLSRLPIDAGDLAAVALLAPGVVATGGDSTAGGFSIAGQRPSANVTQLDGLTFGGGSIPQDAVRATRVVTSTYDVARGQFSGGLIASTTRSGTNTLGLTLTSNLRDPALAAGGGDAFTQAFGQKQLSFGAGGPIVKDRLFWFAAGQGRLRDDRLLTLQNASAVTLARAGIAPDSAARFQALAAATGVPSSVAGLGADRAADDYSGIARVDWVASETHTFTLRGDWRRGTQEPARLGPFALPSTGGTTSNSGGGAQLSVASRMGAFVNEFRAYLSGSNNAGDPYLQLPQARVLTASTLGGGATGAGALTFGGNPGLGLRGRATQFEGNQELSWLSPEGSHRVKLGVFYNGSDNAQDVAANLLGSYTYNSLADLEANRPALFTRTTARSERTGSTHTAAAYLGDTWRLGDLQLTLGLRAETSWLGGAPAPDPVAQQLFGLRTDRLPTDTRVLPRLGFSWFVPTEGGPPRLIVRGGIGAFRSPIPLALASSAQAVTGGATSAESQLVCAGPAVPLPDWPAFLANPAAIPTQCAGGAPPGFRAAAPSLSAFTDAYTAPYAWRGSLGVTRRINLFSLGVEASRTLGYGQAGFRDANLGAARFQLGGGDGRNVYAPATLIDPATGAIPLAASRLDARYGQVFAIGSDLETRATAVSFTAGGILGNGIVLNASYTWSRADDQSSFADFGGSARGFAAQTAGLDPNRREWAPSDFDRRHNVVLSATLPIVRGFELTWIGRATSGAPYTPSVNGDINGDGARNDRAFIPDPAAPGTDPVVGAAVSRLLASGSTQVRECLQAQLGRIADRNSCRGPWQPSLDLQLNWKPSGFGLDQRLTISLVTSNLLAGVDQLVHGANGLRGWGQFSRPDPTLLNVRGYDAVNARFRYDVNERFGAVSQSTLPIRIPFQVGIQFRLQLGAQQTFGFFGGGGGGGGAMVMMGGGP